MGRDISIILLSDILSKFRPYSKHAEQNYRLPKTRGRKIYRKITRVAVDMKFPIHIHIHIHRFLRGYPWIYPYPYMPVLYMVAPEKPKTFIHIFAKNIDRFSFLSLAHSMANFNKVVIKIC